MQRDFNFWDRVARFYQPAFRRKAQFTCAQQIIIDLLNPKSNVLELACGNGDFAFQLAKNCKSLTAIDSSRQMIKLAQLNNSASNISYSVQDVCNLGFYDQQFDGIVALNILHVLSSPLDALTNWHQVLKPKGTLLLATYAYGSSLSKHSKLIPVFSRWVGINSYSQWTSRQLNSLVEHAGFTVAHTCNVPGRVPLYIIYACK